MRALLALCLAIPCLSLLAPAQGSRRVPVAPVVEGDDVETSPIVVSSGPELDPEIAAIRGSSSSTGRSYHAEWLHDLDGSGPLEPIVIGVDYEAKPGETATQATAKFAGDVQAMQEQFPPNVRRGT